MRKDQKMKTGKSTKVFWKGWWRPMDVVSPLILMTLLPQKVHIFSNFLFYIWHWSNNCRKREPVKVDPNGTGIPPIVHDARNGDQGEDGESTHKLHKKLHFWRTGVPNRQKVIDKSASFKFYYPIMIYISKLPAHSRHCLPPHMETALRSTLARPQWDRPCCLDLVMAWVLSST